MAKCFSLLNTAYFQNLIKQLSAAATPAELQAMVNAAFTDIQLLESTITSNVNQLSALVTLLTAPVTPTDVINWITSYINNVLTPQYNPYIIGLATLAALPAQVAALALAAENEAKRFENFTITIPTINPNWCTL